MERRIEDPTRQEAGTLPVQQLDPAEAEPDVEVQPDDDLRVITSEGDIAVIRDLRPEPALVEEAPGFAPVAGAPDGATQTRYRMLAAGHVASDILCLNLVLFMTELLDNIVISRELMPYSWLVAIAGTAAWVGIFHAFGLYGSHNLSSPEEVRRVVAATSVGAAVLMIFGAVGSESGTSGELGGAFVLLLALEILTRLAWRRYARILRQHGLLAYRTIVIGSAHDAAGVSRALMDDERSGFFPVGRVAPERGVEAPGAPPFLGGMSELAASARESGAEAIVVASPVLSVADLASVQQLARREHLALRLVARVPHMLSHRLTLQPVGSLMTVAVRPAELSGKEATIKRAFDVVAGSIALLVSMPLQIVIGAVIRLTSPGPVLFRQQRITKDNKEFTVYKFRTMVHGADEAMDEDGIDRTQPFFKGGDAPPVTRVGRVLRALSLDELPQLWNVVRGDMSLVGPRPLPAEQYVANTELLGPRHEVRAGLTGWWQVNGRSDVSPEHAIEQDLFYIENWSLSLDLYIIGRTVGVLLFRRGAR
ncbi:MAG TPA: sugar transferase [Actinomycetota bacterium]|jgi:exopolysaccharide biosynthesis polyprenyl glycosylphosphotransferase|nr:sugar transferase [Actinomycetota bacterium]